MKLKIINLLKIFKPFGWYAQDFFASNRLQDVYDGNLDQIYDDPKTTAVITSDRCDIKPLRLLNINKKTK